MKDPRNAVQDLNKNWSLVGKKKNGESQAVSVTDQGALGGTTESDIPQLSATVGPSNIYDISLGAGDIVTAEGNMNGSRYTKISQSPFNAGTETTLTSRNTYKMPFTVDAGLTISHRLVGVEQTFGVIGVDSDGNVENLTPTPDIAISGNITVATNVWTINTATPHGLVQNDRIVLAGNTDSRLNVGPILITAVTGASSFTITSTLANATYTAGGTIKVVDPMQFAVNGANFTFDNATATNAFNSSRTAGASKFQNPAYTIGTTAVSGTPAIRAQSFLPSTEFSMDLYPDYNYYKTIAIDSTTTFEGTVKRTNQIPDSSKDYKIRYRCRNLPNFSVPIGRITSATKSGTTTATIVTDVPHGLTTSDFVVIQGVRDITNFPNLIAATAVASIISPTSFTVIQGSAVTASSQDGVVFKMNGAGTVANMTTTRGIQSIQASNNELTLNLSGTTTATVLCGDTINVYGLAPALVAYEGVYIVLDNSASAIILSPLTPTGEPGTVANIGLTNTGGMYIRRVDYIIHYTRAKETPRYSVEMVGSDQPSDVGRSVKASIVNSPAVTMTGTTLTGGQTAHSSAATGAPLRTGTKVVTTQDTTLVSGDASDTISDQNGATITKPYQPADLCWTYAAAAGGITTTGDVAIRAAGAASIRNYLTSLQVQNNSATATELVIKDGASTVLLRMYCPANMPLTPVEINIPLRGTAATAMNAAILTAGAAVYVNAQGYTGL